MFSILRLSFALCLLAFASLCAQAQTPTTPKKQSPYDSLYAKAYRLANTQPDSAIYYASQASRVTQKPEEQAKAHWLIGFYAQRQGYYGLAIQDYQKAYELYKNPIKKTTMLDNIALCYSSIDNYDQAADIMIKAVGKYEKLQDSVKLGRILHLLANVYRNQNENNSAYKAFHRSIKIILRQKNKDRLATIYDDLARLKENQTQYDSAIHYQRLALERFEEPNLAKKCIRLVRLGWYYMLNKNKRQARHYLNQALELKQNSPVSQVMLEATHGFLLFVERQETEARQAIGRSDTLLKHLRQRSSSLIQQKFARKLAYEINQSGYELLESLWFYSDERARFAPHKEWFAQRLGYSRQLYKEVRLNVALKDTLVIERAQPKIEVKINKQVAPWWWVLTAGVLVLGGLVLYWARTKEAKAKAKEAQTHVDFVEAIKASPVKGIENITKAEAGMLAEIEHRQNKKLTPDEMRLFILVARGYTYKTISLRTVFTEGNIKTKVRRIKRVCRIKSLKELL